MKLTKTHILQVARVYDECYRGGTGRGDIDCELASVIAWAVNQKKWPKEKELEERVEKL